MTQGKQVELYAGLGCNAKQCAIARPTISITMPGRKEQREEHQVRGTRTLEDGVNVDHSCSSCQREATLPCRILRGCGACSVLSSIRADVFEDVRLRRIQMVLRLPEDICHQERSSQRTAHPTGSYPALGMSHEAACMNCLLDLGIRSHRQPTCRGHSARCVRRQRAGIDS